MFYSISILFLMKSIIQVHRTPGVNYSIEHVFDIVNQELKAKWHIKKVLLPYAYVRPLELLKNILYARRECKGVIHIVGDVHYVAVFTSSKSIITIHDLSRIDFNKGFKRFFFYWLWYYLPLKRAAYITCISQDVKRQLIDRFPFVRDKISTIYDPLDVAYRYVKKEFNRNMKPIILHIGTAPNKNLERVIEALKGIDCSLHVIGRKLDRYEQLLNDSGLDYTYCSDLSDEEMLQEYKNADIISFPSLYEGFGMPIIEGQAVGRAVLTSNLNPMAEIAGGAAMLVNPYSIDEIRAGFVTLINNESLRKQLIKNGLKNAAKFSADTIAAEYSVIYDKFVGA